MSLFDRTFLLSTGITAVICGALYYYFNNRIRELELALVKQSQVLSSFISNVQQEFRGGVGSRNQNELASAEAIRAVSSESNKNHEKIVISDGECVSDSDDDSDDSDSESESESDDGDDKLVISDICSSTVKDDIKVIDMDFSPDMSSSKIFIMSNLTSSGTDFKLSNIEVLSDSDSDSGSDDDNESDDGFEHVPIEISSESVNIDNKSLLINLTAVLEEQDGSLSYWALQHSDIYPDFHNRAGFIPLNHKN